MVTIYKNLQRPLILGLEFLKTHRNGTNWSDTGKFILNHRKQSVVKSAEVTWTSLRIGTKSNIMVQARTQALLNAEISLGNIHIDWIYKDQANSLLTDEHHK